MKHRIQITIDDRKFMFILAVIISVSAIGLVVAYGGTQPWVMGHTWGEMVCDNNLCANTVNGKVGIGTTNPSQKLDVIGQIHATGDICTDSAGGKCLSSLGPLNSYFSGCIYTESTMNLGAHDFCALNDIYHVHSNQACVCRVYLSSSTWYLSVRVDPVVNSCCGCGALCIR